MLTYSLNDIHNKNSDLADAKSLILRNMMYLSLF